MGVINTGDSGGEKDHERSNARARRENRTHVLLFWKVLLVKRDVGGLKLRAVGATGGQNEKKRRRRE